MRYNYEDDFDLFDDYKLKKLRKKLRNEKYEYDLINEHWTFFSGCYKVCMRIFLFFQFLSTKKKDVDFNFFNFKITLRLVHYHIIEFFKKNYNIIRDPQFWLELFEYLIEKTPSFCHKFVLKIFINFHYLIQTLIYFLKNFFKNIWNFLKKIRNFINKIPIIKSIFRFFVKISSNVIQKSKTGILSIFRNILGEDFLRNNPSLQGVSILDKSTSEYQEKGIKTVDIDKVKRPDEILPLKIKQFHLPIFSKEEAEVSKILAQGCKYPLLIKKKDIEKLFPKDGKQQQPTSTSQNSSNKPYEGASTNNKGNENNAHKFKKSQRNSNLCEVKYPTKSSTILITPRFEFDYIKDGLIKCGEIPSRPKGFESGGCGSFQPNSNANFGCKGYIPQIKKIIITFCSICKKAILLTFVLTSVLTFFILILQNNVLYI